MYSIKDAKVARATEHNGTACVEIEVTPEASEAPGLLVYVARSGNGEDFEIVRMIRNESNLAIDWYNNLHNAYEEIAEENFGDEGVLDAPQQREQFRQSLLTSGSISAQLEQMLPKGS